MASPVLDLQSIRITIRMPRMWKLRFRLASLLFRFAGWVSGTNVLVEGDTDFDPERPSTWTRHEETTPDGGKVMLVQYPEGYRLRFHGETVWRQ